jgi:hypothetical protein
MRLATVPEYTRAQTEYFPRAEYKCIWIGDEKGKRERERERERKKERKRSKT